MEEKINGELHRLLLALGLDWGILITGKRGDHIYSCHLSDGEDYDFVEKLYAKLWEGCPMYDPKAGKA